MKQKQTGSSSLLLSFVLSAVIIGVVLGVGPIRDFVMHNVFQEEVLKGGTMLECPLCGATFTLDQLIAKKKAAPVSEVKVAPTRELMDGVINGLVATSLDPYLEMSIKSGKPLVVKMHAPWCPICRSMHNIDEQMAKDYAGKAYIITLDIDEESHKAIGHKIGVMGVPTYLFFANGKEVKELRQSGKRIMPDVFKGYIDKLISMQERKGQAAK